MHLRLLERIVSSEREPARPEPVTHADIVNSILKHLRCLLNTRQGGVSIAQDYGMPEFLGLLQRYPESVREIEGNIRYAIERYEPRLKDVQVKLVSEDDLLSLRFHIDARLRDVDEANVSFESMIDPDGKIKVTR